MPFNTGAANSIGDLLTAFQNFATANGWTLHGTVLSKGACYASMTVSGDGISVLGGTGVDGSNNLTGAGPSNVMWNAPSGANVLAYPVNYYFSTFDNEIYGIVNWSIDAYTYVGFGSSPVPGLPGTGNWYTASYAGGRAGSLYFNGTWPHQGSAVDYNGVNSTGFFWVPGNGSNGNGYVHHGLDGGTWSASKSGGSTAPSAGASPFAYVNLLARQPNTWNGQSVLIPVQLCLDRGSSHNSLIAQLQHVRYVNIANITPGDIITLGTDRWRVWPFYRKGSQLAPGGDNSGYLGIATRYDGP